MGTNSEHEEDKQIHYEGGLPVFDGPEEREARERRAHHEEDGRFKSEQLSISRRTLHTQIGLVLFGIIGLCINAYQANTSRTAAEAAESASHTAADSLKELRTGTGATDTHSLAVQAATQATQTTNLATAAEQQASQTALLARSAETQAAQTQIIAANAVTQARATAEGAEAAKQSIILSQRATILVHAPGVNFANSLFVLPMVNTGRVPAGDVRITYHEVTINTDFVPMDIRWDSVVEKHWYAELPDNINPELPIEVPIAAPRMEPNLVKAGRQLILMVGDIVYSDGFGARRLEQFCFRTKVDFNSGELGIGSCNAGYVLNKAMAIDGYREGKHIE